jgi:hypothetical protein
VFVDTNKKAAASSSLAVWEITLFRFQVGPLKHSHNADEMAETKSSCLDLYRRVAINVRRRDILDLQVGNV